MTNDKSIAKKTYWPVLGIYLLIAFEFFYMASPFAIYFYSVYKPLWDYWINSSARKSYRILSSAFS
jgi:hypothetical protein